jgi:hypothetical protein
MPGCKAGHFAFARGRIAFGTPGQQQDVNIPLKNSIMAGVVPAIRVCFVGGQHDVGGRNEFGHENRTG